jgi:hypothetical protein
MIDPNCPTCEGIGWVCEKHRDQPMSHRLADGRECGGAGEKCRCNPLAELGGEVFASNDARNSIAGVRPPRNT